MFRDEFAVVICREDFCHDERMSGNIVLVTFKLERDFYRTIHRIPCVELAGRGHFVPVGIPEGFPGALVHESAGYRVIGVHLQVPVSDGVNEPECPASRVRGMGLCRRIDCGS